MLLRIDPDRYRLEAERAQAVLEQSMAEQVRAGADLKRREALAQNELLSVEELTRSQGEHARLGASVDVAKAALGIALQNLQRVRGAPAGRGHHQHPHGGHRPVRPGRHRARDDRGREPPAPALQGLGGRVAARRRSGAA